VFWLNVKNSLVLVSIFDYSNFQVFDATNFALLILDFKVQVL